MSKKANQTNRKKGSDKRKNTFKKYGKNTTRGLRIKQAELEKRSEKIKSSIFYYVWFSMLSWSLNFIIVINALELSIRGSFPNQKIYIF